MNVLFQLNQHDSNAGQFYHADGKRLYVILKLSMEKTLHFRLD